MYQFVLAVCLWSESNIVNHHGDSFPHFFGGEREDRRQLILKLAKKGHSINHGICLSYGILASIFL